jgi:hypothetical protein
MNLDIRLGLQSDQLGYVWSGLRQGLHLFVAPVLYNEALRVLRDYGATEDDISRVHKTQPIPAGKQGAR